MDFLLIFFKRFTREKFNNSLLELVISKKRKSFQNGDIKPTMVTINRELNFMQLLQMSIVYLVLSKTLLTHYYCDIVLLLLGCVFLLELLVWGNFLLIVEGIVMILGFIFFWKRDSVLMPGLLKVEFQSLYFQLLIISLSSLRIHQTLIRLNYLHWYFLLLLISIFFTPCMIAI